MKNKLPLVLNRLMKEKKLSQRQLAKLSGVSLSTINGMLDGKKSYSTENLIAIADTLDISLDRLLRDEEKSSGVESFPTTQVLDGFYRLRLEKIDVPTKNEK